MIVTKGLGHTSLITKGYAESKRSFIPSWLIRILTAPIRLIESIIVEVRL